MVGQGTLLRPDLRRAKKLSVFYGHWSQILIPRAYLGPGACARLCRSLDVCGESMGSRGAEFPSVGVPADNPGCSKLP